MKVDRGLVTTKGQTISEWIYEVIVSPKIRTEKLSIFLPCVVRILEETMTS